MPATVAAVIALGYACYSSVGVLVFGFLGGYVKEEGIETGTRYFLLELAQHIAGLHTLSTNAYFAFVALSLGGLVLWCWRTCCNPAWSGINKVRKRAYSRSLQRRLSPSRFHPRTGIDVAVLSALSLVYRVARSFPDARAGYHVFAYVCGFFYLCTTAIAVGYGPQQFLLNKILYGGLLIVLLLDIAVRRWPV